MLIWENEFFDFSAVMMDEENVKNCILCCQPRTKLEKVNLKVKASKWKGLDKYSKVYDSVDWEESSAGFVWHKSCEIEICRERELQQALDRKKNDANPVNKKFKLSIHLLLHAKQLAKVLESLIRKIFAYGV